MTVSSKNIAIVFSSLILLVDITFVAINQYLAKKEFDMQLNDAGIRLKLDYELTLEQTYNLLSSLATYIGSDQQVLKTFYEASKEHKAAIPNQEKLDELRANLNEDVQNKWQKLQKDFLVRQLHFYFGPGSTSFLRVHKPEKYGDNMDDVRHTIAYANKEFKPVTGFETGRVYSGLRSVIPLFYETNEQKYHIGALEAGASFDQVLTILSEHLKIESAVLLKEKHVKANMWPEAIEQHFVESAINDCTCYLEASTTTQAKQVLQSALNDGVNFSKEGSDIISVEGHFYSLTRFPLRDFKADMDKRLPNVGSILLWRNVDQAVQSFESNKLIIYGYGVFGFLIVEILFFLGLRLTSGHLKDIIKGQVSDIKSKNNELNQAQRLAKLGSWQYNIVNDELTWSDEIYRIFEVNKDEFKPCYRPC